MTEEAPKTEQNEQTEQNGLNLSVSEILHAAEEVTKKIESLQSQLLVLNKCAILVDQISRQFQEQQNKNSDTITENTTKK